MTLVVIARYDDLPAARMAESFLRDAGLEPSLADGVLTSIDPLLMRALGGVRLSVPSRDEAEARDLLARAEAGEFATPLPPEDAFDNDGPAVPRPLAVAMAVTMPEGAYGVSRRPVSKNWVRTTGVVLVLIMLATLAGLVIFGLAARFSALFG
ncbi:putative signal transducing protein [Brevundimonas sp.]|uniref:putative signal transducing protein n=1 Tax=Brevundimonas sp. TaxID=1871086 RepID=UPI0035B116CA